MQVFTVNNASNFSTTSGSFVDISATALGATLTPKSNTVTVHFHGALVQAASTPGSAIGWLDLIKDGVRVGGDDGICQFGGGDNGGTLSPIDAKTISFTRKVAVTPDTPTTIKLQWKCYASAGSPTIYLLSGAGTSLGDTHPQFWIED